MAVALAAAQRDRSKFPNQAQIEAALENPRMVKRALECMQGKRCNMPYGTLLRRECWEGTGIDLYILIISKRLIVKERKVEYHKPI